MSFSSEPQAKKQMVMWKCPICINKAFMYYNKSGVIHGNIRRHIRIHQEASINTMINKGRAQISVREQLVARYTWGFGHWNILKLIEGYCPSRDAVSGRVDQFCQRMGFVAKGSGDFMLRLQKKRRHKMSECIAKIPVVLKGGPHTQNFTLVVPLVDVVFVRQYHAGEIIFRNSNIVRYNCENPEKLSIFDSIAHITNVLARYAHRIEPPQADSNTST